jgi:hypothetical protein
MDPGIRQSERLQKKRNGGKDESCKLCGIVSLSGWPCNVTIIPISIYVVYEPEKFIILYPGARRLGTNPVPRDTGHRSMSRFGVFSTTALCISTNFSGGGGGILH